MIRRTSFQAFRDKGSSNAVLAMLNFENSMPERDAHRNSLRTTAAVVVPQTNAKIVAVDTGPKVPSLASAHLPRSQSDNVFEDWEDLFNAVADRLRLIAAERHVAAVESQLCEADRIRGCILECVEALDQLHATLKDGLGQRLPL